MNIFTNAARTAARRIAAAARWLWGCFTLAVTSAHKRIDANDIKVIATKMATPVVAGAGLWAGFKHALHDPEALAALVGGLIIFGGAIIEGIQRYHAGEPPDEEPQ